MKHRCPPVRCSVWLAFIRLFYAQRLFVQKGHSVHPLCSPIHHERQEIEEYEASENPLYAAKHDQSVFECFCAGDVGCYAERDKTDFVDCSYEQGNARPELGCHEGVALLSILQMMHALVSR